MGAWGVSAFENDDAADWLYELETAADLSVVEATLYDVESAEYVEAPAAAIALAACEVLARLVGNPGQTGPESELVDAWVARRAEAPSEELIARAAATIDRIVGENSELAELWSEAGTDEWRRSVDDLRARLLAQPQLRAASAQGGVD